MPQINDTTGSIKTSSIVRVDAKAEGFERIAVQKSPTVDIGEGNLFIKDASGFAVDPTAASRMVYLQFENPLAPQVSDAQKINIAGGTLFETSLQSGGYAGIVGDGLRIGLPFDARFFVAADIATIQAAGSQTRLTVKRELDALQVYFNRFKFGFPTGGAGALIAAPTADESNLCFGIVDQLETPLIWFTFTSMGIRN